MSGQLGKRGFVTIATGRLHYYRIAANLLKSYRATTDNPYPFAILAEDENQYTKQFDYTLILEKPDKGYLNKLRLFEYLPFEETIFVDADCLAYGDLNAWWDMFRRADDFSVFGTCYAPSENKGWFSYDGMKEWKENISFVPSFNGGVYYIRNTEHAKKVFDIALSCISNFNDYSFNGFSEPADEPLIALGMSVCEFRPIPVIHDSIRELLFYPIWDPKRVRADITIPKAEFCTQLKDHPQREKVRLIHWSAAKAKQSVYKTEVWNLEHPGTSKLSSELIGRYMKMYDMIADLKRAIRPWLFRAKRIVQKIK